MHTLILTDLDDSIMCSTRRRAHSDTDVIAASLKNGEPISYQNPLEETFVKHLASIGTMVPVTARNMDAFARVHISFPAEAIIDYGGIILDRHRSPDPTWLAHAKRSARLCAAQMNEWENFLFSANDAYALACSPRRICDFETPFYLIAKSQFNDTAAIDRLGELCAQHEQTLGSGWVLHVNGNNLALLPPWLDKANAADQLIERYRARHRDLIVLGIGDSRIDLGFMSRCDYMITPSSSQIASILSGDKR